jgi:hypothetical protein
MVEVYESEHATLVDEFTYLESWPLQSSIMKICASHMGSAGNIEHIDYVPTGFAECVQFDRALQQELRLRNAPITGTLSARRQRLRELLEMEQRFTFLTSVIESKSPAEVMAKVEKCIPCILHAGMRAGEKVIGMILMEGMTERDGRSRDQEDMLDEVQEYINKLVLGDAENPTQWEVPTVDNRKQVGEIKLSNWRVKKFIESAEGLIRICIEDEERQSMWLQVMPLYRQVFEKASQHEDYTDEEIKEYQHAADRFFELWVPMTGLDGQSNYIHMIRSGHFRFFLEKWQSLYRYEQEGWEGMNKLVVSAYVKRQEPVSV